MNGSGSTKPSTSGEGGSIVESVPLLPEAVVEVSDFEGESWWGLEEGEGGGEWDQQDGRARGCGDGKGACRVERSVGRKGACNLSEILEQQCSQGLYLCCA